VDLAERFQKLIDEYNAGSQNIEVLFAELVKFAGDLTDEERRGVAEGLTDEELALFDILTKPEPVLTKAEEADVKRACRELLDALKRETLVPDWREKQQAKAAVMQTIKLTLPPAYTKEIRVEKLARAYAHVYDHYYGSGQSAYQGPSAG
jgi:type I site-specific restriction-modification system R (restriction) subunit